jgi:hypothetical protein
MTDISETRFTAWVNVTNNWTATLPTSTPEDWGRAYARMRVAVARLGGDVAAFDRVWPDLGTPAPCATRIAARGGMLTVSAQYVAPAADLPPAKHPAAQ